MDFDNVRWLSFDCFGTLIDWEAGILAAVRPILARCGIHADDNTILERYAAIEAALESPHPPDAPYRPYRDILRLAMKELGRAFNADLSDADCDALPNSLARWPAFPDTAAALRRLQSRFRIAILSNIDNDLFALARPNLGIHPDALITAQDCRSYKPARRNFETLLARLPADSTNLVHVAQSLYHDIAPAAALGLRTVWINSRAMKPGHGATPPPPGSPRPTLEVTDLATLANLADHGAGSPPR